MSKIFGDVTLETAREAVDFWAIKTGILLLTPVTRAETAEPKFTDPFKSGIQITVVYGS